MLSCGWTNALVGKLESSRSRSDTSRSVSMGLGVRIGACYTAYRRAHLLSMMVQK